MTEAAPKAAAVEDGGSWVTSHVNGSGFRTDLSTRTHRALADEPLALGGTDAGPTPYEYLLMAVAYMRSVIAVHDATAINKYS